MAISQSHSSRLKWASEKDLSELTGIWRRIRENESLSLRSAAKDTKIFTSSLSPGCRICIEGGWSCLFINGFCHKGCFFCPAAQEEWGPPMSSGIPFSQASDYADYAETLGFKGISLSGGEPLLSLDRSLDYISAVKSRLGDRIHAWIYTNGMMAQPDTLKKLRDAGLDEIRFNIAADAYDLSKTKMSVGIIETVTVEIPSLPEDEDLMLKKLPQMQDLGIDYLNLNQLYATPHNSDFLSERRYSFERNSGSAVVESELSAIRLMERAMEKGLTLPIHYCSWAFKNRFQSAALRRRSAKRLAGTFENITEKGYIRRLGIAGPVRELEALALKLRRYPGNEACWMLDARSKRLYFNIDLWDLLGPDAFQMTIEYHDSAFRSDPSYFNMGLEIDLPSGKSLFAERWPAHPEILLSSEEIIEINPLILKGTTESTGHPVNRTAGILQTFEAIDSGPRATDAERENSETIFPATRS